MYLQQISKILETCKKFVDGDIALFELADALGEPLSKLHTLLTANDIIDFNSRVHPWINYQDLVNVICLYYAMASYKDFKLIGFTVKRHQATRKNKQG